jgi:hypothetical protein
MELVSQYRVGDKTINEFGAAIGIFDGHFNTCLVRFQVLTAGCEDTCLVGYNAVWSSERQATYRWHRSPPSSGSKSKQSKRVALKRQQSEGARVLLAACCWWSERQPVYQKPPSRGSECVNPLSGSACVDNLHNKINIPHDGRVWPQHVLNVARQ